jgi:hypothetical protein
MNKINTYKKAIIFLVITCFMLSSSFSAMGNIVEKKVNNNTLTTTTAIGTFWLDFKPENDHDGGKFEGDDEQDPYNSLWKINTRITNDDFDDTGRLVDWAQRDSGDVFKGIYSKIRIDEDLNDDTSAKGAWCVGAAEQGGTASEETSNGYTNINSDLKYLKLSDYCDDINRNDFKIISATFYCKYKFASNDFDNECGRQYAMFNIYIQNNDEDTAFLYFDETSPYIVDNIGNDYPGNGKCIDYWSPTENFKTSGDWHEDSVSYQETKISTGQTLADWLNRNALDSSISLHLHLDISLIGGWYGNKEMFKFWVDNIGIKCDYQYDSNPALDVPEIVEYKYTIKGYDTHSVTIPVKNKGDDPLSWSISNTQKDIHGNYYIETEGYRLYIDPTSGQNLVYGGEHSVSCSFTYQDWMPRGKTYTWHVSFKSEQCGSRGVDVQFGVGSWAKQKNVCVPFEFAKYTSILKMLISRLN